MGNENSALSQEWANACLNNDPQQVKNLIQKGNMNHNINGVPVQFFCMQRPELLRLFIENKLDVDSRTIRGESLIHQAASQNYVDTLKFLIENGADFSCQDSRGKTPFEVACEFNRVDSMRLLLKESRRKFPSDKRYFDMEYVCKDDIQDYEACKKSGAIQRVQDRYKKKLQVCKDLFEEDHK